MSLPHQVRAGEMRGIDKSVKTHEFPESIVELDILEEFEMWEAFRHPMNAVFSESLCEIPDEHDESYNEVSDSRLQRASLMN